MIAIVKALIADLNSPGRAFCKLPAKHKAPAAQPAGTRPHPLGENRKRTNDGRGHSFGSMEPIEDGIAHRDRRQVRVSQWKHAALSIVARAFIDLEVVDDDCALGLIGLNLQFFASNGS